LERRRSIRFTGSGYTETVPPDLWVKPVKLPLKRSGSSPVQRFSGSAVQRFSDLVVRIRNA
jgi:hypothetical protein